MKLAEDIRYVQYICIAYNFNDHQNFICKASVLLRYDDTNNFRIDFEDILPHYNNKIRRCMTRQRHTAIEFCCYSVHYMDVRDPKCCRSILNKATRCQPNIATKFFFS